MAAFPLRILHVIHDFLPRSQAGSEIYAHHLCRALLARGHHVTLVCATFDPSRSHGHVHWRSVDGLPVIEIVNNWICERFEDTYRSPLIGRRLESVLEAVQPEVVHVHNLLNLSFDLPTLARAAGARVVATLHDYTVVCPSGGHRLHQADAHLCQEIEPGRCVRCFGESPYGARAAFGRLAGRQQFVAGPLALAARLAHSAVPRLASSVASHLPRLPATAADVANRLDAARSVFDAVELFVAPSPSIASEFARLGLPPEKMEVSDYGFRARHSRSAQESHGGPLRIGFVGTPVWHKGLHVLIAAARLLQPGQFTLTVHGNLTISPEYAASLRNQAPGLPVHFAGPVDHGEAASIYEALDVLVVPSIWLENSPLVVHEAFMAGVPVVGSRIGGLADLIDDGRNGLLVEPADAGALAAALQSLVDTPALLHSLSPASTSVKSIEDDAAEWEARYRS